MKRFISARSLVDHFTHWQVTVKNDARSNANCGLRQVNPIALTPAASLAVRYPRSRSKGFNLYPKLLPVHRPRRSERLCLANALVSLQFAQGCYEIVCTSWLRFETGPPGLESNSLTSRLGFSNSNKPSGRIRYKAFFSGGPRATFLQKVASWVRR
jgi:hypothetical protein